MLVAKLERSKLRPYKDKDEEGRDWDLALGAGEGGGAGGLEEFFGVLADVAVAEDGVAGDEEFSAGANDVSDGVVRDAAIDFNAEGETAGLPDLGERGHLVERIGDELLTAEAGVYGHDENVVDDFEDFAEGFDGSGGIDDHTGFAAMGLNEVERAVQVDAGFLMDGNPVGTGFGEGGDELIGIFDHQMAIEGNAGKRLAERSDYGRADGDVGDKVAVHDVEMEDGAAAIESGAGVDGKLGEVGGEDRGC